MNVARKVVSDLKEYGKVQRAMIGIKMQELTPGLSERIQVERAIGYLCGGSDSGGAAEKGRSESGDVILQLNG